MNTQPPATSSHPFDEEELRFDRLIEEGRRALDPSRRMEISRELHRILHDDQPYTWILQTEEKWAVNRRLRGVEVGALGLYFWNPGPRAWWIERAGEEPAD